ncbi:MAG: lytic transglycosylase domain-containing protein [Acetobacteraceae bacterium]|nr:lytic transglycosylase domain-containing protein [Acetobacteraceae bacterium]
MAAVLVFVFAGFATASVRAEMPPDRLCTSAIDSAKRSAALPPRLLEAIAQVESGRPDPASGRSRPWPWTINVAGTGYYFESAPEAVAFVKSLQDKGVRSIDVGCMQVNLLYHPEAFSNLDEAFDPHANVQYAIRFLQTLYHEVGNWPTAVGLYHSANPVLSATYRARVLGGAPAPAPVMTEEDRQKAALVMAWRATLAHDGTPQFKTVSTPKFTAGTRHQGRVAIGASHSARIRETRMRERGGVEFSER